MCQNKEEDVRTFEDGQSRNCTQSKEVYVSTDSTGADQAYNLYNLHPLLDLLSSALGLGSIKENAKVTFLMDIRVRLKSTRQTMTDNLQSTSVHRLRVGTLLMELFQKEYSLSLMTATIVSICKERSVLHLIILERNTNLLFVQSLLLQ